MFQEGDELLQSLCAGFDSPAIHHFSLFRGENSMTREDLIEALVESVIFIGGPSGSGKTTLMHKLKKKHPKLFVADTDDWYAEEAKKYNTNWDDDPVASSAAQKKLLAGVDARREKVIRAHQGPNKHAVLVGMDSISGNPPGLKLVMLGTGAVRSAYRRFKRDRGGNPLRSFPSLVRQGTYVRKFYANDGYTRMSASKIQSLVASWYKKV